MNRPLTGRPEIDIQILLNLPDEDLFRFCRQRNRYINDLCNNEDLWRNRFLQSPLAQALAPGLTDPIDILQEIQRYGNPEINTWRKLYYYLTGIERDVGLVFLNLQIQPDEKLFRLLQHIRDVKLADFNAKYPLESGRYPLDVMRHIRDKSSKIIQLKPEIRAFLVEHLLSFYQPHAFGNDLNNFIIFSHGITSLGVLYMIVMTYIEAMNVPDEYYILIYDDADEMLLLEDSVTDLQLTPEELAAITTRVNQEGELFFHLIQTLGRGNRDHLKY